MEQSSTQPPAWRRKRTEKRSAMRARRVEIHQAATRTAAAQTGNPAAVAAAEWDILRAVINRLPEAARDGEWAQLAVALKRQSSALEERHRK